MSLIEYFRRANVSRSGQAESALAVSLARDFNAMAGAPGDNVFMVKMAYWFGR